jgi:hypothetical protein
VNEQDKDSDARNMEELGDVYKQTFDNIPAWGLFAALGMFVGAVYYRGNPVWQAVLMGAGFALIAYLESPYARRRRALRIIRKRAAIELALARPPPKPWLPKWFFAGSFYAVCLWFWVYPPSDPAGAEFGVMFSGLFMAWVASVWFTEMRGWQIERALWFYRFYKKRLKAAPNCRRFEKQVSDARVIYLALAAQVSDLEGCEDVLDYEDEG